MKIWHLHLPTRMMKPAQGWCLAAWHRKPWWTWGIWWHPNPTWASAKWSFKAMRRFVHIGLGRFGSLQIQWQ